MPVHFENFKLEAELAGAGMGWTNLTSDVRESVPMKWGYGIRGNTPLDRVADPGAFSCALDNSGSNSAGLFGYYSPDHANCRAGFAIGIKVRMQIKYAGAWSIKFVGTLANILPTPNTNAGPWITNIVALDWMDDAGRAKIRTVPIQINKRFDEILSAVIADVVRQPEGTLIGTGHEAYPYALDNSDSEGIDMVGELDRLARSEAGFVYPLGDGTIVGESRTDRASKGLASSILDNTMFELVSGRNRDDIFNHIRIRETPRVVDAAPTSVIFDITDTSTVISLGPGQTQRIVAPYTDPGNRSVRIGAMNVQTPLATTDYMFNAAEDGSGADLTADLSIAITKLANVAFLDLSNTGAATGYVTALQLRGQAIRALQQVIFDAEDAASEAAIGENVLDYEAPYQSDSEFGRGAASYFLNLSIRQLTNVTSIRVSANYSAAVMAAVIDREPGDRVTLKEAQTGISADFFIQAVDYELRSGALLDAVWSLAPASTIAMWLMGVAGASELGSTTVLGF